MHHWLQSFLLPTSDLITVIWVDVISYFHPWNSHVKWLVTVSSVLTLKSQLCTVCCHHITENFLFKSFTTNRDDSSVWCQSAAPGGREQKHNSLKLNLWTSEYSKWRFLSMFGVQRFVGAIKTKTNKAHRHTESLHRCNLSDVQSSLFMDYLKYFRCYLGPKEGLWKGLDLRPPAQTKTPVSLLQLSVQTIEH